MEQFVSNYQDVYLSKDSHETASDITYYLYTECKVPPRFKSTPSLCKKENVKIANFVYKHHTNDKKCYISLLDHSKLILIHMKATHWYNAKTEDKANIYRQKWQVRRRFSCNKMYVKEKEHLQLSFQLNTKLPNFSQFNLFSFPSTITRSGFEPRQDVPVMI